MPERASKAVNFAGIQAAFDWAVRLAPILGVGFQFYLNQDRTINRSKTDDKRIEALETSLHQMEREVGDVKSNYLALKQAIEDQKEYYVLTTRR